MHKYLQTLLYLTGLLVTCSPGMAGQDEPLVIGAIYNLHGFQANLDIPSSHGARLSVTEVNHNGGLPGRQVKLAVVDGFRKFALDAERLQRCNPMFDMYLFF